MQPNVIEQQVWELLTGVPDPEIPVISIVELGIVREVEADEDLVEVTITPTYSGCPAMFVIEEDILDRLKTHGFDHVTIRTVLSPVWTTDWLTEEAKAKLKAYGIAPPNQRVGKRALSLLDYEQKPVSCPRCSSINTLLKSSFGSTACKALYYCNECMEPFDYFKCI